MSQGTSLWVSVWPRFGQLHIPTLDINPGRWCSSSLRTVLGQWKRKSSMGHVENEIKAPNCWWAYYLINKTFRKKKSHCKIKYKNLLNLIRPLESLDHSALEFLSVYFSSLDQAHSSFLFKPSYFVSQCIVSKTLLSSYSLWVHGRRHISWCWAKNSAL